MPTYREDLHLGHKVPLIESDDISNEAITPEKLDPSTINVLMGPVKEITDDLQNQIDSFNEHGLSVSNKFGNNEHIGISQKTLTRAINNIYAILEGVTGQTYLGFTWQITPEFFVGESASTIRITAQPSVQNEVLEHIELSVNDVVIEASKRDNVTSYSFDLELSETATIKCTAYVLGVKYERQQTITHYPSFWVGAGATYSDVMTDANLTLLPRSTKEVTCEAGDNIVIVINDAIKSQFIRADINGVEIPFTESTIEIDNITYRVYTSENTYVAGTYNIDING